jgi:hypothetical protein
MKMFEFLMSERRCDVDVIDAENPTVAALFANSRLRSQLE